MRGKSKKTIGIEAYVIDVMCLRLHEAEALAYLKERGFDISDTELYRIKQEIRESTNTRLNRIASQEFMSQHIERIDTLKTIHNELWSNYKNEKNPFNKSKILMQIAELQTYISSFYDSTQYVMQQGARLKKEKKKELEQ